jgi:hypothetical protein
MEINAEINAEILNGTVGCLRLKEIAGPGKYCNFSTDNVETLVYLNSQRSFSNIN